jgi:hypothetical protein
MLNRGHPTATTKPGLGDALALFCPATCALPSIRYRVGDEPSRTYSAAKRTPVRVERTITCSHAKCTLHAVPDLAVFTDSGPPETRG